MHHITTSIVRAGGQQFLRARCSCHGFLVDVPRLSTAGRRKQNRLIGAHLAAVADPITGARLLADDAIEGGF